MIPKRHAILVCSLTLVAFLLTLGCAPKSPEEQVAMSRAEYTVTLNSFLPQRPEPEPILEGDMAAEAGEAVGEAAAMAAESAMEGDEEAAEGEEMEEMSEDLGPQSTDILFDLIVRYDGTNPLSGLTLEVSHADAFEKEKASFRHWLELPPMVKSETKQVSFVREIPNFEDGDLFSVELRSAVPAEERGEYREFSNAP